MKQLLTMNLQDVHDFNARRRGAMYRIKSITDIEGNSKAAREPYASMVLTVVANVQLILNQSADQDTIHVEMERVFDRYDKFRHAGLNTGYLTHVVESRNTIKFITERTVFELVAVNVVCQDRQ